MILVLIQILLLIVQICCYVYAGRKDKSQWDVMYGFSVWGCIPNILLMLIAK